jgi:hypothetical protein
MSEGRWPSETSSTEWELGADKAKCRRYKVYLFRAKHPHSHRSMLACAAPYDLVESIYGGGISGPSGILATFGALSIYKSTETTDSYLAVWGPRKAETVLATLRASGAHIEVVRHPPPARLVLFRSVHRPDLPQK